MCGIAGWFSIAPLPKPESEVRLKAMCDAIAHRGPDDDGYFVTDQVALGMRRLSIIDLHTGDQPVYSEDRSIVVMMNGELYNYREVKADLEKRGHKLDVKGSIGSTQMVARTADGKNFVGVADPRSYGEAGGW